MIEVNLSADIGYANGQVLISILASSEHVCGSDNGPSYGNDVEAAA